MRSWFFVILLVLPTSAFGQSERVPVAPSNNIQLAATEWCPYVCNNEKKPGFIVEYLRELLSSYDVSLDVFVLPWSRAIFSARQGTYDGLLTAVPSEAPDFLFSSVATGSYQMCFFGSTELDFHYDNREALQGKTLGIIHNYGYGEPIDGIIEAPVKGESIYPIASSDALNQLIEMTRLGRIDLFVEDRMVVANTLIEHPHKTQLGKFSCFEEIPFFTAISPQNTNVKAWQVFLTQALSSVLARKLYRQAKSRYQ